VLSPEVLSRAIEKALARLTATRTSQVSRRDIESELKQVQAKVDRLVDALADGTLPADEIRPGLAGEKTRRAALQAELAKLDQLSKAASLDTHQLRDRLQTRVSDTTILLGDRHHADTRALVTKRVGEMLDILDAAGRVERIPDGRYRPVRPQR
jgi:acetyl-CoA carboxylase alpha subunit